MDLVDMGSYKNKNKGYYWILTSIEILSRYAFTIPVYRKDYKNVTKAVTELLRQSLIILNWLNLMMERSFTMLVLNQC